MANWGKGTANYWSTSLPFSKHHHNQHDALGVGETKCTLSFYISSTFNTCT